ncbi:glycerophosphodiester phosphodiesterase [Cohnella zeiphila]|uniref:Glycerophosphodiester phosphodiesterase n=1 Tax=Cohnella zeiphila TaxID=2761120 RepID=A0A7X0VXS0_9BACL|nr:glycerophosphodiester phosphodiesterase [Cohnella zeiphila]MBB6732203.1 glycerophosphodiester phosphodiesterase [Cohnella zeiphila]
MAHRGASGTCPENTMAAFERAVELGANGIETDVHLTRDGRLALIHDATLDRTTGEPGSIRGLDFAEIREKDAGSWFGQEFRGQKVPAMEELFELAKGRDLFLNVELKFGSEPYPGMEEAVIAVIRRYGMEDQVILSSFNHDSLALVKRLAPEVRTGILYGENLFEPWNYAAGFGTDALHAWHGVVTPEKVKGADERGLVYFPYTINEAEEMKRLIQAGVAGVITDYPDLGWECYREAAEGAGGKV